MRFHSALQPLQAVLLITPIVCFYDAIRVKTQEIARIELNETSCVRRVRVGTEDRPAVDQVFDSIIALEQKRWIVTSIRIDQDPARLQLAIEQRYELRR